MINPRRLLIAIVIAILIIMLLSMLFPKESSAAPEIRSTEATIMLPNGNIVNTDIIYTSDTTREAVVSALGREVSEYTVTGFKRTIVPSPFFYNPAGEKTSGGKVVAGFTEWNGITPNFSYSYSGTTNLTASQCETGSDGSSVVSWGVIGIPNVLGISCWGSGDECDIKLSVSDWNWADIAKGVSNHEAGHCGGLGHSDVPTASMYPLYHGQTQLDPDDIAAICSIYGGCLPVTVTPISTVTMTPTAINTIIPTSTRTSTRTPTATPTIAKPTATVTPKPTPKIFHLYLPGVSRN